MYQIKSKYIDLNNQTITDNGLMMGRSPKCDVIIRNSKYVSEKHLKIYVDNGNVYIEDQNSTNGTYLNDKKVTPYKAYKVNENEYISLGNKNTSIWVEKISNSAAQMINNKTSYTVGRDKSNDIVIDVPVVSSQHLRIEQKNGKWYFYDLNSSNGTYYNSPHNPVSFGVLNDNEIIYLGNYKILTNNILKFLSSERDQKIKRLNITKNIVIMGRDSNADFCISHPSVSSHHAKITKTGNGYELEDLNSTNGTYVNGLRVKRKSIVNFGDEIQLGIKSFILNFNNNQVSIVQKGFVSGWSIEAKNISIELANGIKLLDDICFTANPGELVGLMGLSGAGKTTLLKALNGYTRPTSGTSLVNGNDLYKNFNLLKSAIGYVPQDDIVHSELNVKEALRYYAKLRIASDIQDKELDNLIDTTLKKLGLDGTQETLIGSPDTGKGISGGQRKRVNLAMELLADPQIIFLDEPTSGLSAVDTKMVMHQLRQLADEGKTIIITIHQPSFDVYKMMDNQIVLSYGKLAYYGPTYPNSINYFNPDGDKTELLKNPDNALIGLNNAEEKQGEMKLDPRKDRNKKGVYWKEIYKKSKEYQEYVLMRTTKEKILNAKNKEISSIKQFYTLVSRYLKIKLKDITNTSILLIQAPLIALMATTLFSDKLYNDMPTTLLFVVVISSIWFGIINASREIVAEKSIYERERMIGIKLFPYILSKFFVLSLLCAVQSIALVGIIEAVLGLNFNDELSSALLLTFLVSLGGLSIGLLVSTIAKSQAQALALVPIILLPMIIFAGGMMTVKQMGDSTVALSLAQVTPTKWALEEMTKIYQNQSNEDKYCLNDSEIVWKKDSKNVGRQCKNVYNKKSKDTRKQYKYKACMTRYDNCIEVRNFHTYNYGDKAKSSSSTYIALLIFILLPLIIMMIILKRRDNI